MHTTPSKSSTESTALGTAAGGWRHQLEALTIPAESSRTSGREEGGGGGRREEGGGGRREEEEGGKKCEGGGRCTVQVGLLI